MRPLLGMLMLVLAARAAVAEELTMGQAVSIALSRNHEAIAAALDIDTAMLDRVQAGLYPNPILSYTLGNIVLGPANDQMAGVRPSPFGQTVHSLGISEVVDIWAKRNTRLRAADRSVEHKRLQVQDALREIVYAVRSSFADVLREQSEFTLAKETQARYEETVGLSRKRFAAGDISDAELKKVELEGLRYQNGVIDSEMQLDLARQKLAALLALGSADRLPSLQGEALPDEKRKPFVVQQLIDQAFAERPDVQAARVAKLLSEATLTQARREAFPDISLGLTYTHSEFTVSGDNPNSLALGLSLPIPVFDRNQANIGRAQVDIRRAENDAKRLAIVVQHEVADAARRALRSDRLLDAFEGGMLERADSSLKVAEKSYKAGAVSLLELLEAQRTYIEIRSQYLRAMYDYRQAAIDVLHAIGEKGVK